MRTLWAVAALLLSGCFCQPVVCTSNNCQGCCDAAGACHKGDQPQVCGSGGTTCSACASTQTCTENTCQLAVDGGVGAWALSDLDPAAVDATYLAMAVDPAQERIGVAWFTNKGTQTMPGVPDYELKYVEWRQGVTSTPQTVTVVQRLVGLAAAFDPLSGEPVLAYLGGGADQSLFWFQSDAVINRRSAGATWTETAIATRGDQVTCGVSLSDRGFLVGLWPALAFDSAGKLYFAYRDAHAGQFSTQDWGASDVELWEGLPPPTASTCVAAGDAAGGHNQLVIGAANQPALIYDQMADSADNLATNVVFQKRNPNGTWTPRATLLSLTDTQSGASFAWDSQEGYGVAVLDRSSNELLYVNSTNGTSWSARDTVFGAGSGGWYPSLAMDPVHHEPTIAFVVCSPDPNTSETACLTSQDSLQITQRVSGQWSQPQVVDPGGAARPKLGFFASGKRFVVYRTPQAIDSTTSMPVTGVGRLKLAIER